MRKALILFAALGCLVIVLAGCQGTNGSSEKSSDYPSEGNSSTYIHNLISSADSEIDLQPNDNDTNVDSSDKKSNDSSLDTTPSGISGENNNFRADIPNSTSSADDEASPPSSSNGNISDDFNQQPHNNAGAVIVIDGLLELESEGQARGEIEAGMKIDYRKAALAKGSSITFNVDCKRELTDIRITLTDLKTGHYFEDHVIGNGESLFEIDADGEYVVTIENCSDKGTHFTINYRINEKTNAI